MVRDILRLELAMFSEGTQPEFPFPNLGDPPGTPTDSKKKPFHFF